MFVGEFDGPFVGADAAISVIPPRYLCHRAAGFG
jgi:hypothetical protein